MNIFEKLYERLFGDDGPNAFEMTETMWGYIAEGAASFREGYEAGKGLGHKLQYEVTVHVADFKEFKSSSGKRAPLRGWVTCKNLFGEKLPIHNGEYGLYLIDQQTGQKRITYNFDFTGSDGKIYHYSSYKVMLHEPWTFDILEDQTVSYATISRVENGGEVVAARGIVHYHVETFPAMVCSMRVPGQDTLANRLLMTTQFYTFVAEELGEYIGEINPFYQAGYVNMVCQGLAKAGGEDAEFFFFSGVHDRGFPWGDYVSFADIGLILREGDTWRRFVLTEYALAALTLRLREGIYRYEGVLYEITNGYQSSFSEMHRDELPGHLRKVDAKLNLRFSPKEIEKRNIPFRKDESKLDELSKEEREQFEKSNFLKDLQKQTVNFPEFGYTTQIHRLTEIIGELEVDGVRFAIQTGRTLGEGELGKLVSWKNPRLYYNYFCAVAADADRFRLHVRTDVLSPLGQGFLMRKSEQVIGDIIGQIGRMDLEIKGELAADLEQEVADGLLLPQVDLLEINNDHFPNAAFQRRVVVLPGINGKPVLALEEDMSVIELDSIESERSARVAAIRHPDRFHALDAVLDATGFFELLDAAWRDSGKDQEDFSILIKPNFSFMYSLTDISTFTDPNLVEHLVDRIVAKGFRNIAVVEAQSTYTVFFTNRDVPTLAKYIGLRGKNYRIIDLSENTVPYDYGRTLGRHAVHPAWRDADFRISFAKNKTHSYAYYTLTIKNIYGALPKKNKFKEYHCNQDLGIYVPAIDFIDEFPVHFGLIDAYFSADGPFGIFADPEPNFTSTIIGGDSLVAVDWVGASKMGYDPMVSGYMRLAVQRFGKPKIKLAGDQRPYLHWNNVPEIVSKAAFEVFDQNFVFGDFLYSAAATMDPFFTFTPDELGRKIARLFTRPLRKSLFEWVKGKKQILTIEDLKKIRDPEQWEYLERLIRSLYE